MFQLNYTGLVFVGNICPKDQMDALNELSTEAVLNPLPRPDWYQDPKEFDEALSMCIDFLSRIGHLLEVSTFDEMQECNSESEDSPFQAEGERLGEDWIDTNQPDHDLKIFWQIFEGKKYVYMIYCGVYSIFTTK
jgi:hypothetical protein